MIIWPATPADAWTALVGRATGARSVYRANLGVLCKPRGSKKAQRISADPPKQAERKVAVVTETTGADLEQYEQMATDLLILADRRPPKRAGYSQSKLYDQVRGYNAVSGVRWTFVPASFTDDGPRELRGAFVTDFADGSMRADWPLERRTVWYLSDTDGRAGAQIVCVGDGNWYAFRDPESNARAFENAANAALYYAFPFNLAIDANNDLAELVDDSGALEYASKAQLKSIEEAAYARLFRLATAPAMIAAASSDALADSAAGDAIVAIYADGKEALITVYDDASAAIRDASKRADELVRMIPYIVGALTVASVAAAAAVTVATVATGGAVVAGAGAYSLGYGGLGNLTRAYAASKGV